MQLFRPIQEKELNLFHHTYSNGAVYADFDNDGDLDVVVNNVDEPALLYQNKSNDKKDKPFIEIKLNGPEKNINALGAKVIVFVKDSVRTYENYPVRGFLSSMQTPIHIGFDKTAVDSILLVWPDNTYQHIQYKNNSFLSINYQKNLPKFNYAFTNKLSKALFNLVKCALPSLSKSAYTAPFE